MACNLTIHNVSSIEFENYPDKIFRDNGVPFYSKMITIKDELGNNYKITLLSDNEKSLSLKNDGMIDIGL